MMSDELQETKKRVQRLEPAFNKDFPTDKELVEMALEDMPKLIEKLEAKEREIERITEQRRDANHQVGYQMSQNADLKDMLDACAEQRDAATNDIEHLLDQIETKEQEIEGARWSAISLGEQNKRLREELELLTEIVQGSDNVDQSNREYDRLKGEFDRLKGGGETEIK
jgi:chromosome segregation ATPase